MTDRELIRNLRICGKGGNCLGCELDGKCSGINNVLTDAADRLEALLDENEHLREVTKMMPKWRPASEPPEEYCRCLVLLESGDICDVEFEVDCNNTFGIWQAMYDYDTLGFLDSEWYEIETVTHWMPRPSTEEVKEDG